MERSEYSVHMLDCGREDVKIEIMGLPTDMENGRVHKYIGAHFNGSLYNTHIVSWDTSTNKVVSAGFLENETPSEGKTMSNYSNYEQFSTVQEGTIYKDEYGFTRDVATKKEQTPSSGGGAIIFLLLLITPLVVLLQFLVS